MQTTIWFPRCFGEEWTLWGICSRPSKNKKIVLKKTGIDINRSCWLTRTTFCTKLLSTWPRETTIGSIHQCSGRSTSGGTFKASWWAWTRWSPDGCPDCTVSTREWSTWASGNTASSAWQPSERRVSAPSESTVTRPFTRTPSGGETAPHTKTWFWTVPGRRERRWESSKWALHWYWCSRHPEATSSTCVQTRNLRLDSLCLGVKYDEFYPKNDRRLVKGGSECECSAFLTWNDWLKISILSQVTQWIFGY